MYLHDMCLMHYYQITRKRNNENVHPNKYKKNTETNF